MRITQPTVLIPGSDVDIGMTARLNRNGFVAVDVGMACDKEIFTAKKIAEEKAQLPGWRFRREYLREWSAQKGQRFFAPEYLDKQKKHICEPLCRMDLDEGERKALVGRDAGRVLIWVSPSYQPGGIPALYKGAEASFGIGIDVGEGVGESDSTIEVFLADTREQAAEFRSNVITPQDLARLAAAIAKFYNNALICCVRPMHGITVIRTLIDECGYSYLWRDTDRSEFAERQTKNLGWSKGESSNPVLFGGLRDDLQYDFCTLHSMDLYQQLTQYIYDEFGHITLQSASTLPLTARAAHGDLVVAAALARRACLDLPKFVHEQPRDLAPVGSYNDRRQRYELSLRAGRYSW